MGTTSEAPAIVTTDPSWSHAVAWSHIYGKPMPQLYHQPCGRTWLATTEQARKITTEHVCTARGGGS